MPYGLYMAAEGAQVQSQILEVISNNLANVDTAGFKRDLAIAQARNSEAIELGLDAFGSGTINDIGGGVMTRETATQFSSGPLKSTGISTDMAITGDGFFQVEKDGDVLNTINNSGASVLASINDSNNGIDIRSRLSGSDFSIGERGGTTATDFGFRSFRGDTDLADLNHGRGVHTVNGNDFGIRRRDGTLLEFDASSMTIIQDVLDAINNHADNQVTATQVTARLATSGNGIELVTTDTSTIDTLTVVKRNGSQAAEDLGLIPVGGTASDPPTASGSTLTGRDVNKLEVNGVFNALSRLANSLAANDKLEMERSIAQLKETSLGVNFARAELGARQQGIDILRIRLQDEEVELRTALSEELDVDIAEAITNFTARQASLQASLQTAAAISRLTLLDFL